MKKILLSRRLGWGDAILLVLTAALISACICFYSPFDSLFRNTTEIEYGYIGRASDGVLYVVDEGHSRLIAFDENGKELYRIVDPSDNGESILYIDDFAVDGENLYLCASEWNGMMLDRELILRYDLAGRYLSTVTEAVYDPDSGLTNKHRFYGLRSEADSLIWAECLADEIRVHRTPAGAEAGRGDVWSFPYVNAFNAVSDIVFEGGSPVVLNKNGRIERFDAPESPTLLYSSAWVGEEDRIPFRIAILDGRVYFTDIRARTVQAADPDGQTSITLWEDTDSQTVTFTPDGSKMLLVGTDGLTVCGDRAETYRTLSASKDLITRSIVSPVLLILLIAAVAFLLFRAAVCLRGRKPDRTHLISLVIIGVAAFACTIISWSLIQSFRSTYLDKIREQLLAAGCIVAAGISEEDMDEIDRAEDFGSEAYERLCGVMQNCLPMDVDFYRTTYCNILRLDESGQSGFGIAYLDRSIGVYFPLDEVETDEVIRVYETKTPVWNDAVEDVTGVYLSVKTPVVNADGSVVGVVAVGADTSVVEEMLSGMQRRVLLSTVLILLLFWILSTEIISVLSLRSSYRSRNSGDQEKTVPIHLIRLLVFAVFAAYNLVSSFLPVYVLRNAEFVPEGFRELAASLPITVNIFVMGIMSLFCANAVRRFGIRRVFTVSMLFSVCGNLLLFLARGYAGIFAGLFFDGIGVGLVTNAIYIALTYLPDEHTRQDGFSTYNAACLSGINLGMILGGILAVRIGQKNVFLVVFLIWILLIILAARLARQLQRFLTFRDSESGTEKSGISTCRFLRSKPIWSFFLMIQNPCIVFNSFVFFFVPLFCDRMGYQETVISILLVLYSQTAAMLSGILPDRMEKALGGRSVYAALFLNVAAVAIFALTRNIGGLIAALLILGTSAAFAKPTQQTLFLRQKASRLLGEDKAMGIYNFSENIGESLGPVIFSAVTAGPVVRIWGFLGFVTCLGITHFVLNVKEMARDE